ncbi:hypothetical protein CRYUN_Cryun19dG0001000 [Craigia yunnanensis]
MKQDEGWVVCRVFKKRITTMRKVSEHESPCWYDDQVSFIPDLESPKQTSQSNMAYHLAYSCKKELDLQYQVPHKHYFQLPLLESPKLLQTSGAAVSCNSMAAFGLDMNNTSNLQSSSLTQEDHIQQTHEQYLHALYGNSSNEQAVDQVTDWRVLDKFVASQLSQEEVAKENNYSSASANNVFHLSEHTNLLIRHLNKQEMVLENASTSASSCQIDLWK